MGFRNKIASVLLSVVLACGLVPQVAFAQADADAPAAAKTATVSYRLQSVGNELMGNLLVVGNDVEVSADEAESLGFADSVQGEVSALDVLVRAHEDLFGMSKDDASEWLVVSDAGYVSKIFGTETTACGFLLNGGYPNDGTASSYGGYTGTTVTTQAVATGDVLDFFTYQDATKYSDRAAWFCADGAATGAITVAPGSSTKLVLKGTSVMDGYKYKDAEALRNAGQPVENAQLATVDAENYTWADVDGATTNDSGEVTLAAPQEEGTYYYTAHMPEDAVTAGASPVIPPVLKVVVKRAPLPQFDSEWPSFRNSDTNMGITNAKTPRTTDEAQLLWGAKVSSGWSDPCSSPIIVDDYLYVMVGAKIEKVDKKTGEVKATAAAAASGGYTVHLAYGDGMIFAPVDNGQIQAFNADTLQSLWVSEPMGGQTLTPITYANGYVYTGFAVKGGAGATFVCLSATDEDPAKTDEVKHPTWACQAPAGGEYGYYWAGACVVGDVVVFGSDTGVLTSYSATKNQVIDTFQADGDIRCSIAREGNTLYFTTKAGKVYSIAMSDAGVFDDDSAKAGQASGVTESTCTPVVYNGRVYVGGGTSSFDKGTVAVMDAATMRTIYSAQVGGKVQSSALLSTAYAAGEDGAVYAYFTYNNTPGGIVVLKDAPGQTEAQVSEVFTPEGDMANYCICSLVCDSAGTIYYKNDSGYLMAVGTRSVPDPTPPDPAPDPDPTPTPGPDPDPTPTFADVDYSSWYGPAVSFVAGKGLMRGYDDGSGLFGVGEKLTRGELATILWRNARPDEAANYVAADAKDETGLPGTADGMFYTAAANWAVENGVITGIERADGSLDFAANEPVTFEQMVTIVSRLAAAPGEVAAAGSDLSAFADGADASAFSRGALAWAAGRGLVTGYIEPDGAYLRPGEDVARERAAKVLAEAFELGILQ